MLYTNVFVAARVKHDLSGKVSSILLCERSSLKSRLRGVLMQLVFVVSQYFFDNVLVLATLVCEM